MTGRRKEGVAILPEFYDKFYAHDSPMVEPIRQTAHPRDRFEFGVSLARPGRRVLDIGCGNGRTLRSLEVKFDELHGTEISAIRAGTATKTTGRQGRITKASALFLPYKSASYEAVLLLDVIEHLPDVRGAIKESFRVLKPGGQLLIATPNIAFVLRRLKLLAGRFPATSQANEGLSSHLDQLIDGGHFHYFTYSMVQRLVSDAGFGVFKMTAVGRWQVIMSLWPTVLSPSVGLVATK